MTRPTPARDQRTAVDKAMSLLNAFGDDALLGVGVSELARRADLSKSTAFRLLTMLQNNGAVERAIRRAAASSANMSSDSTLARLSVPSATAAPLA